MNLVDLVVLACTLASPSVCHEYHNLFQSAGSLRSCMLQAPPFLAQWVDAHPGYRIARWRCAWPDQEGEKT
jgi:hypothetical protein